MAPIVCKGLPLLAARSSKAYSFLAEMLAGCSGETGCVPRLLAMSTALYGRLVFANLGDANQSSIDLTSASSCACSSCSVGGSSRKRGCPAGGALMGEDDDELIGREKEAAAATGACWRAI